MVIKVSSIDVLAERFHSSRARPIRHRIEVMKCQVKSCQSCGDVALRYTTVHNGRIVSRADLIKMDDKVDDEVWQEEKASWRILCRFCAQLETARKSDPLDTAGFYFWLKGHDRIKPSTAYEYSVRIKRVIDHFDHQALREALAAGKLIERVMAMVPTKDAGNYRRALQKYIEFSG